MAIRPLVAIFWFIADDAGVAHHLTRGCPLYTVEPCGDHLTFPQVHHNIGEAWRRHALLPPIPALRSLVTSTGYDAGPHGHVVYEQVPVRFVIRADPQPRIPPYLARIHAAFVLLSEQTVACTAAQAAAA